MRLSLKHAVLILFIGLTIIPGLSFAQSPQGVSDERFARLARGINLPFWFWYAPDDMDARFSDADFSLIRALGLTYVRVPIDLGFILDENRADLLNVEHLAAIDRGIERLLARDLAVVIDLHSTSIEDSNAANYSLGLEDPEFLELFIRFWRSFAAHLSQYDPEMLFVGPMNEPVFEDRHAEWLSIQERILAAIRESAPQHTLIATGAQWSSLDTLVTMEPLQDPNIVYDFHFYEPFLFTHQGATWSWDAVVPLRGVPYPSTPENVQPVIDRLDDAEIQGHVRYYGDQRWDSDDLDQRIKRAAIWADSHNVRVICTEFGVFGLYAPPDDRAQWVRDVRTLFESYDIGWAMWEYDGDFGLVRRQSGDITINVAVAQALGLLE